MNQVTYTAVKENARGLRIWIEGRKLVASGFDCGVKYCSSVQPGQIVLQVVPDGDKTVTTSKRGGKQRPIIDLRREIVENAFKAGDRLRVVFYQGSIKITRHHEDSAQEEREERFRKNAGARQLNCAEMFAGGGVSLEAKHSAIVDAGLDANTVWIAEADTRYIESAGANCFAVTDDTAFIVGSVEEVEPRFYGKCDVLSFSMPCAGVAATGKAKHKQREEEHSGTALFGVVAAIRTSNPAVITSENVKEAQNSPIYLLLKEELRRLGYTIFEQVLDRSHTGTFEQRRRYWLTAISSGLAPESVEVAQVDAPPVTLQSLLDSQIPGEMWSDNTYLKEKAKRDAEKKATRGGGSYFARQILAGHETTCGTIGRFYHKKRSSEPFIGRADGKERLLTPREHARVKSAPEYLVNGLAPSVAHQILGQSVDYLQPYKLMQRILQAMGVSYALLES